jgi:hypothetical protein
LIKITTNLKGKGNLKGEPMSDLAMSFLAGFLVTGVFLSSEFMKEIEYEEKTIREGLSHLNSRCDYRIFLISVYILSTFILSACFYSVM